MGARGSRRRPQAPPRAALALALALAAPGGAGAAGEAAPEEEAPDGELAEATRGGGTGAPERCAHDPEAGVPNPLGQRVFVRIERSGEDVVFLHERLPSIVGTAERASVESLRRLVLYGVSLERARALLRGREDLWAALAGEPDPAVGYAAVDDALRCR